jgi:hypothetical protein
LEEWRERNVGERVLEGLNTFLSDTGEEFYFLRKCDNALQETD